jgi:hypothetical protein
MGLAIPEPLGVGHRLSILDLVFGLATQERIASKRSLWMNDLCVYGQGYQGPYTRFGPWGNLPPPFLRARLIMQVTVQSHSWSIWLFNRFSPLFAPMLQYVVCQRSVFTLILSCNHLVILLPP